MRYPLLDSLRGLAAVWVFLHHVVYTFPLAFAPDLLRLGYFGVPMFFVISGYCLTAAGRRAIRVDEAPGRFLLRRVIRIYPPFLAATIFTVAVYALLPLTGTSLSLFEDQERELWKSVGVDEWFSILTLSAGFRPSGELPWDKFRPVNLAFWTLAIELQFYAVVWVAVRAGRQFYAVLAAVTVASVPFLPSASAFSSGWFLPFWPFFALGVALYAALEFGGNARSVLGSGRMGRAGGVAVLAVGVSLLICGLTQAPLSPNGSREMMFGELTFATGLTAILWLCWYPTDEKRAGFVRGTAQYLGAVSYAIYLLHIPLMLLVSHAVVMLFPTDSVAFLVALVVAVCAMVYPFYQWVERPCMTTGRSRAEIPPKTSCVGSPVTG